MSSWESLPPVAAGCGAGAGSGLGEGAGSLSGIPPASIRSMSSWESLPPIAAGCGAGAGSGIGTGSGAGSAVWTGSASEGGAIRSSPVSASSSFSRASLICKEICASLERATSRTGGASGRPAVSGTSAGITVCGTPSSSGVGSAGASFAAPGAVSRLSTWAVLLLFAPFFAVAMGDLSLD